MDRTLLGKKAPATNLFTNVGLEGAAVASDGYLAVGTRFLGGSAPVAFRSTDGLTWTAMPDVSTAVSPALASGQTLAGAMLSGVAELPGGTVVVAGAATLKDQAGFSLALLLLTSVGNGPWTLVRKAFAPVSAAQIKAGFPEPRAVAVSGGRIVVGGADVNGGVVWVGEPGS